MIELTRAYLFDAKTITSMISENIFSIQGHSYPYYLVVVSKIQEKVKISIYPSEFEYVLKVILNGTSLDAFTMKLLPTPLIDNIIHSSGIINIKSILVYEFYIVTNYETRTEISNHLRKIRNLDGINLVHEKWIRVEKKY